MANQNKPEDYRTFLDLHLSRAEAKHVAHLIRQDVRKRERQRKPFTPAPGKRDAALWAITQGLNLLAKFEDALDTDIQVWEDEVFDDDNQPL